MPEPTPPAVPMPTKPKKKAVQLYDILREIYNQDQGFQLKIQYDTDLIASGTQVFTEMIERFADYYYSTHQPFDSYLNFLLLWTRWNELHAYDLWRAWSAMRADYNPIENYDMTETAADGKRIDKTKKETEPTGKTIYETQQDRNAIGSGTYGDPIIHTTTETSYDHAKSTETETPDNTQSMQFNGSTYCGYHDAAEHMLQRHGNIGVQTAADMIEKEISLREKENVSAYIKRFIDHYCYYVG